MIRNPDTLTPNRFPSQGVTYGRLGSLFNALSANVIVGNEIIKTRSERTFSLPEIKIKQSYEATVFSFRGR